MRRMEEQADDLEGVRARARGAEDARSATLAEVGRLRSEVKHAAREKLELSDALDMMAEEAEEDRSGRGPRSRRGRGSWRGWRGGGGRTRRAALEVCTGPHRQAP